MICIPEVHGPLNLLKVHPSCRMAPEMDQGSLTHVLQPMMALFPLPEQLLKDVLQSLGPIFCGKKAFAYISEQVERAGRKVRKIF